MQDLGTLSGIFSGGSGINASGQVTGDSNHPSANHPRSFHAFVWDPATGMRDLGGLGKVVSSHGSGINDSGQVTGSSTIAGEFDYHAFLWDPATGMKNLGTLGGGVSYGHGINASGQVTGVSNTSGGPFHAFLWDGSGMLDLNDLIAPGAGWTLFEGNGINDAGQITGSGRIGGEEGQVHAYLLMPVTVAEVPEPGTLALTGAGAIGLGLLRRRKGRDDT